VETPVYSIQKINKFYQNGKKENHVLKELCLDIYQNDSLGILGSNGAGKTTLIKIMIGILAPTSGNISFLGNGSGYLTSNGYKSSIGIVLEGNRNLYWYMTIMENLSYFGSLLNVKQKVVRDKAEQLLDLFVLREEKDRKVGYLSRGMQQKVAIMVSLLNDPSVLFLDEPTLGLDVLSKKTMIETIKLLRTQKNITLILTTHQIDVLAALAERVVVLKDGYIKYDSSIEQLRKVYSKAHYTVFFKEGDVEKKVVLEESEAKLFVEKLITNGAHLIAYNRETTELEDIVVEMIKDHENI